MVRTAFRLMNSSLLDPNNHVPAVSPDDGWGDAEGISPATAAGPAHLLPPRRTLQDRSSSAATTVPESGQTGLRLGSNVMRGKSMDSLQRLEVQEINGTVVRLDQMTPAPPKVPRQLTFHERPARDAGGKKSPDETLQWGIARRRPTHWLLVAGVAVATIVVSAMMVLPAINAPNAPRAVADAVPFVEEKIEGIEAMNRLLAKQPEAMRIFSAYATATRIHEILPLLRDGDALKATLQAHWRPREISKAWEPAADPVWTVLDILGHPCAMLQGTFPDHSKFAAFFTNDGNQLQLDWKATTGFGTATFGQLASNQGDPAEIRGEISCAEYYSDIFPEADYQSYRLIAPDGATSIWCYARRGEAADDSIAPLLHQGESGGGPPRSRRITLRLERGPTAALSNQWSVGEMLHLDWVTP